MTQGKDRARYRRFVRHRRSHGGAAREGWLQGLRHQQTGSPGRQAIVRDAAPRRDQRRSVEAAVSEVMRRHGRIDLLVNNAGFGVAPAGAEESSLDQAR